MDLEEIKREVRSFFARFIGDVEIDENENLFRSGLVNSLFAMQLVLYIEKEYKLKVARKDLDIKNFSSIKAISNYIDEKLSN